MKKKKVSVKELTNEEIIYKDIITKISKDINNQLIFEISNDITSDLAEGVAILMRIERADSFIWNIEIENIEIEKIQPERCLYWLSGGDKEWNTLENYKYPWFEIYLDYQMEFGTLVIDILSKAKKLKDIRTEFIKKLNLPTLYEFALSKNIIR